MDEGKEKVEKIEERGKGEVGMVGGKEFNGEEIGGKFVEGSRYVKGGKERGGKRVS